MANISEENVRRIGALLKDGKRPLKERFRALFSLKNINGPLAIECISAVFGDPSALLKHELAYCLGQMGNRAAVPVLVSVLEDVNQEGIVRHEAAEALGAIGDASVSEILERFAKDEVREVAETCQLALERLAWLEREQDGGNVYGSVDPAPALKNADDVATLTSMLLDERLSLFQRYRAMFTLRDRASGESGLALTAGLKTASPLFSHEIAFVLGQMQQPATIPALIDCLSDTTQNEMVRHECAEALGALATPECRQTLRQYLNDDKRVVRESCEIALDMCDYETSPEFQYAII